MIRLRPDCLEFKTSCGGFVASSVEQVTIELMGEAAAGIDPELIKNAAHAVLHYFQKELGRTAVSVGEFSLALEKVLRGFGLEIRAAETGDDSMRVAESDLRRLVTESGEAFELVFFPRLREELRLRLGEAPQILRFNGLRDCAKSLTGSRRWSPRCQNISDQIVDYLRTCFSVESAGNRCALLIL